MTVGAPRDALILAGGFGTRLRSIVNDVPKPMAPVEGRPFLEYLLDYWVDQGIERFVLSTGYLGHLIKGYFGRRFRASKIEYIHESTPLGTGGAVRLALREANWHGKQLVLINGDTWFEADVKRLVHDAERHQKPVTITLKAIEANDRYGGVAVNREGLVTRFGVRHPGKMLINTGCYLLAVSEVESIMKDYPGNFSFEEDLLKACAETGQVAASIQDRQFLDIGVPEDYRRAAEFVVRHEHRILDRDCNLKKGET
ncbi:MAG: nucleotidyltransferase family protein [Sulfuricaulis sp.]